MKNIFIELIFLSLFASHAHANSVATQPETLRALYTCNSLIMEIKLIDRNEKIILRSMETFAESGHCITHQGMLARNRNQVSSSTMIAVCNGWRLRTLELVSPASIRVIDDTFTNSYRDCLEQSRAINGAFFTEDEEHEQFDESAIEEMSN